ncbi:MAG: GTPase HflX [FCB group bacterium]
MYDTTIQKEKAIAIAFGKKGTDRELAFEHLNELESLADTAGAEIIEKVYQELAAPNPATIVGKGKIEEIKFLIETKEITLVIFDDDLSPSQLRNLENELEVKIIDRSGLIIDIFAKHAKSLEAQTQVELAQSQYLLPKLSKMWTHLSKQYGGIGTKGPGETQIETDRRALRMKIQRLKDKLKEISVQKEQQKKGRASLPRFSLIGYTNAGKSSLMNTISDASVFVEDKLFATLDTTVRAFNFPNGQKGLLSDTVGFIRKLPTHLIASFRSTLAEAADADILIHVVDVSHKYFREHIKVVDDTLEFLKLSEKPTLLVFNKIDLIEDIAELKSIENEYPGCIFVSAMKGMNILNLQDLMQRKYDEQSKQYKILLPYSSMDLISKLYSNSDIISRNDKDDGVIFEVKVIPEKLKTFEHYFGVFIM